MDSTLIAAVMMYSLFSFVLGIAAFFDTDGLELPFWTQVGRAGAVALCWPIYITKMIVDSADLPEATNQEEWDKADEEAKAYTLGPNRVTQEKADIDLSPHAYCCPNCKTTHIVYKPDGATTLFYADGNRWILFDVFGLPTACSCDFTSNFTKPTVLPTVICGAGESQATLFCIQKK